MYQQGPFSQAQSHMIVSNETLLPFSTGLLNYRVTDSEGASNLDVRHSNSPNLGSLGIGIACTSEMSNLRRMIDHTDLGHAY